MSLVDDDEDPDGVLLIVELSRELFKRTWKAHFYADQVKKDDMNKLVMNFLVTEAHLDAAKTFAHESGTNYIDDLECSTDRDTIKQAILRGNVTDAIEKLRDFNPLILDSSPQLLFHLRQQQLLELIRIGKTEESLEFAYNKLAPIAEENPQFLSELESTVVLLAFEDTKDCPVSVGVLLDPSQRLKTANEVNAAILTSEGHEKNSMLLTVLRWLIWAQNDLYEEVQFPWSMVPFPESPLLTLGLDLYSKNMKPFI